MQEEKIETELKVEVPLWTPSNDRVLQSNLTSFTKYIETLLNKKISSYEELHNWSVTEIEEFWKAIWTVSGIIHSKPYEKVLSGKNMLGAKWFEGAELNFAENLLRYRDNYIALISSRENSVTIRITYSELYSIVASLSLSLRELGVKKGDRVVGFVNNIPESIIAMLAASSLGAIWSSCSPDLDIKVFWTGSDKSNPKFYLQLKAITIMVN